MKQPTMEEIADLSQVIFDKMFTAQEILKGDSIEMHKETWEIANRILTRRGNMKIEIELTEDDIGLFADVVTRNETVNWTYITKEGVPIDVEFISEDEMEQRNK